MFLDISLLKIVNDVTTFHMKHLLLAFASGVFHVKQLDGVIGLVLHVKHLRTGTVLWLS